MRDRIRARMTPVWTAPRAADLVPEVVPEEVVLGVVDPVEADPGEAGQVADDPAAVVGRSMMVAVAAEGRSVARGSVVDHDARSFAKPRKHPRDRDLGDRGAGRDRRWHPGRVLSNGGSRLQEP